MAWTKNRNGFIDTALELAGIVSVGNNSPIHWVNKAAEQLQAIIEDLNNSKIMLEIEWATKTFSASSEVTGTDSNVYTSIQSHTSAADNKPITGANWTTFWKKTGSTGGVWATDTSYSSIGDFDLDSDTLEAMFAYIRLADGSDQSLLNILPFSAYSSVPDKYTEGLPQNMYVNYMTSSFTPHAYLYYQPDLTTYVLNYLKVKKMDSCDTATSVPDLRKAFWDYLQYKLAYKMTFFGGNKSESEKSRLEREAERLYYKIKISDFHRAPNSSIVYGAYSNDY